MSRICKKCGKCCQRFHFYKSKKQVVKTLVGAIKGNHQGNIIEYAKYLVMIKWTKEKAHTGQWVVSCKLYDEKIGCTIHSNRPQMCKLYPYGKKGEHQGCGYKGRRKK